MTEKCTVYIVYRTTEGKRSLRVFSVPEEVFFDVDLLKNTIYNSLNEHDVLVNYGPIDNFDIRLMM